MDRWGTLLLVWAHPDDDIYTSAGMMAAAARAIGSDRFAYFITGNAEAQRDAMLPAHQRALEAIKAGPGTEDQFAVPER